MEKQGYEQQPHPAGMPPVYQHDPNMPPPMQQQYSDPNMIHQQPMMQQQGQYYQGTPMASPPPQMAAPYGSPPPQQQQGQYFSPPGPSPQPAIGQHPPAPQQQGSQYKQVTPIASLGRSQAPVDCPACGQRTMTNISYEAGNSTHAWAAGLCLCLCLGCIPYLMNSLKDVNHKCGKCGVLLATWHRSGSTDVHIHS